MNHPENKMKKTYQPTWNSWTISEEGLKIIPPADLPSENAVTFKIERKHPFGKE